MGYMPPVPPKFNEIAEEIYMDELNGYESISDSGSDDDMGDTLEYSRGEESKDDLRTTMGSTGSP